MKKKTTKRVQKPSLEVQNQLNYCWKCAPDFPPDYKVRCAAPTLSFFHGWTHRVLFSHTGWTLKLYSRCHDRCNITKYNLSSGLFFGLHLLFGTTAISGWILAVNFRGWNQQFLTIFWAVLGAYKRHTPLHIGLLSPRICTDLRGVKNPWKIGGNPPIGGKESTLYIQLFFTPYVTLVVHFFFTCSCVREFVIMVMKTAERWCPSHIMPSLSIFLTKSPFNSHFPCM